MAKGKKNKAIKEEDRVSNADTTYKVELAEEWGQLGNGVNI